MNGGNSGNRQALLTRAAVLLDIAGFSVVTSCTFGIFISSAIEGEKQKLMSVCVLPPVPRPSMVLLQVEVFILKCSYFILCFNGIFVFKQYIHRTKHMYYIRDVPLFFPGNRR